MYGRIPDWTPKWANRGTFASADKPCVEFFQGKYIPTDCTGTALVVCEQHSYLESCLPQITENDNYYVGLEAAMNWDEAKIKCES